LRIFAVLVAVLRCRANPRTTLEYHAIGDLGGRARLDTPHRDAAIRNCVAAEQVHAAVVVHVGHMETVGADDGAPLDRRISR
jgi:hypothetical protein